MTLSCNIKHLILSRFLPFGANRQFLPRVYRAALSGVKESPRFELALTNPGHPRNLCKALDPTATVEYFSPMLGLGDVAVRWHAASQTDVSADNRTCTDRNSPLDSGSGIDHDIMFHDWMSLAAFQQRAVFI